MLKRFLPLLAAAMLCGVAAAQGKIDPFDAHCADIVVLQLKPVQKELGVSEAQRKKLNEQANWHQSQLKLLDQQVQKNKQNPNSPEIQGKIADLFAGLKARVLTNLTPVQIKRLGELSIQRVGDAALTDPIVAKKVGMSDAQIKKLQATFQEGAKKYFELEQQTAQKVLLPYKDRKPKDQAEAQRLNQEIQGKIAAAAKQAKPRLDAIKADYAKRIKAMLTSSQATAFAKLKGKPFRGS